MGYTSRGWTFIEGSSPLASKLPLLMAEILYYLVSDRTFCEKMIVSTGAGLQPIKRGNLDWDMLCWMLKNGRSMLHVLWNQISTTTRCHQWDLVTRFKKTTRSRKLTENRFAIEDKKSVAETHHSNFFKNAEYSWIFCYDIQQNSGEETFGFAKPPVFYSVLPAEVCI